MNHKKIVGHETFSEMLGKKSPPLEKYLLGIHFRFFPRLKSVDTMSQLRNIYTQDKNFEMNSVPVRLCGQFSAFLVILDIVITCLCTDIFSSVSMSAAF